ncbi:MULTISPECIES: hypothetical protein [unclassified Variovorax]|uniref:hypothetical protein n=1 Tax=unclassified Variovorax TaxID=663243 RepID=UPI0032E78AE3
MHLLERLARGVVAHWEHGDLAEAVNALDRHLQGNAEDRVRHAELIERAIDLYQDDDIQIDANASLVCESEAGAFVMGWLWVSGRDSDAAFRPEATQAP